MANEYKILGQTTNTAGYNEFFNVIKDGRLSKVTSWTIPTAGSYISMNANETNWLGYRTTTSGTVSYLNNGTTGYNGLYLAGVSASNITVYANQGLNTSGNFDATRAIPINPSTLHYVGFWGWSQVETSNSKVRMEVSQYAADGSSISSVYDSGWVLPTSNTWVKYTGSFTTASNAAYLVVWIEINTINVQQAAISNPYIATTSAANATAVAPFAANGTGTAALLTTPFNKRIDYALNSSLQVVDQFAGALTDVYTVPAGKQAVVSNIAVSNNSTSATTYRVFVVKNGETIALKHSNAFDTAISGNATDHLQIGATLGAGDKIRVAAENGLVGFTVYGSEITP